MKLYHGSDTVVNSPDVEHSREKVDFARAWLDFIVECRLGNDTGAYDVIRGGVANDKVFDTCELYFKGLITKETAIERLRFATPNLQLCFKNNRIIRDALFYSENVEL